MFDELLQSPTTMVSLPRNGFLAISQTQTASTEQAGCDSIVGELVRQEVVPEVQIVGGHLPVYSATSPRRSQRGLKRRAPPDDEIWY